MKKLVLTALLFATSHMAFAAEHEVHMMTMGTSGMMVFEPAVLKVAVGDTVNFIATNPSHNSESVEGLSPEGAATWKGAISQPVSVTVDKEGVYVYECQPHAMMAMVGVIVAGNPVNLDAIKAASGDLKSKFVANQDRLDTYLAEIK